MGDRSSRTAFGLNRRNLFHATAAAGIAVGIGACSDLEEGPDGTAAGTDELADLLPTYTPYEGGIEPDLPGQPDGTVTPGYLSRPAEPVQVITEAPMTTGEDITAITPLWNPTPPGLADNSYFQAVNEILGGTVEFNIADGNTYGDKITTILASGDVPDMFQIPGWEIIKLADFTEAANELFADLSPFLAGDKAADYPLLASYPTAAWAMGVFGGKLLGIPWERAPYTNAMFARQDILDELSVEHPTNLEELLAIAEEINDPSKNRWAFASIDQTIQEAMGVPTLWRNDDGKLVHKFETEEFAAAVEFTRQVFDKGLVHPDYVADRLTNAKEIIGSGQAVFYEDGLGAWHEMFATYRNVDGFDLQVMNPMAAEPGGTPTIWRDDPAGMFTFIKKDLSEERIKECLRVANWCSTPFGTVEADLVSDGVEGVHFTIDDEGVPQRTELGQTEVAPTYMFLSGRSNANNKFQYPGMVEALHAWETNAAPFLDDSPFQGLRVEMPSDLSAENEPMTEAHHEIYRGQREVADWTTLVDDWRTKVGDSAREYYTKVAEDNDRL
ncbi:extracellular solute-binding protein [Glycomyces buryatensis]|uniref:Extracellular solute-binding protein n=1 Tax=Glycomyces buryatensis TaxID=2570927 RepID=A0A4S8QD15_9ACTN|nr:extracellular solute-binding protein [Glycomyces buryatensis]THV40785.1 extracellular solute-binding protein [Glycomyces buryatensis]